MNSVVANNTSPAKRTRIGGGRAFHSRLEPFVDFIREQRQSRRTWREIAVLLGSQHGCVISTQGLHQFCQRYARRRRRPHWEQALNVDSTPDAARVPARQIITASVPAARSFRRPNPDDIKLNDPTRV
jgi:hypothetical protein